MLRKYSGAIFGLWQSPLRLRSQDGMDMGAQICRACGDMCGALGTGRQRAPVGVGKLAVIAPVKAMRGAADGVDGLLSWM